MTVPGNCTSSFLLLCLLEVRKISPFANRGLTLLQCRVPLNSLGKITDLVDKYLAIKSVKRPMQHASDIKCHFYNAVAIHAQISVFLIIKFCMLFAFFFSTEMARMFGGIFSALLTSHGVWRLQIRGEKDVKWPCTMARQMGSAVSFSAIVPCMQSNNSCTNLDYF